MIRPATFPAGRATNWHRNAIGAPSLRPLGARAIVHPQPVPTSFPMTSDYLRQLLDFHYWARDRLLLAAGTLNPEQYARPMGNSFSSVRDTLNHVYLAEWIWYSRWNGVSPTAFPEFDLPDLTALNEHWLGMEIKVRRYIDEAGEAGLNRVIPYRLLSGKESASPLWQMVVHVVNHATYHRGQVTTLLRQLGAPAPQSTDMITYFREV
jgi:uncharacterized damage-inducible protein DinB